MPKKAGEHEITVKRKWDEDFHCFRWEVSEDGHIDLETGCEGTVQETEDAKSLVLSTLDQLLENVMR